MSQIQITLPDGNTQSHSAGITGLAIAQGIGEGLARVALAIEVNGQVSDLHLPIEEDASIRILTFRDDEGVEVFRHSSAHLLAQAVVSLFPDAKPTKPRINIRLKITKPSGPRRASSCCVIKSAPLSACQPTASRPSS